MDNVNTSSVELVTGAFAHSDEKAMHLLYEFRVERHNGHGPSRSSRVDWM